MVCLLESILPICVISHIASFLPHESLKNLTGVSSTFQPIAERVLYRTIVLHSGPSFLICLQTIVLRRGPALWVRSLTVFIHYTSRLRRRGSLSPAHHHLLSRAIQLSQNLVELCFSTLDPHFSISYLLQIPNADEHREHRVKPCNLSPARILTQWLLRKPDVAVLGSPIHFDLGVLYPTFLPNLRSLSVFNLEVAAPMLSGRRIELIKLGVPSRNFEGFVNFILPALSTGIVPLKGFDCEFDCSARNLSLLASTLHQHLRSLESIRIELVGGNIAVHDVFLKSFMPSFSPTIHLFPHLRTFTAVGPLRNSNWMGINNSWSEISAECFLKSPTLRTFESPYGTSILGIPWLPSARPPPTAVFRAPTTPSYKFTIINSASNENSTVPYSIKNISFQKFWFSQ